MPSRGVAWGLGFGVWGLGFGVWGLGFWVWGLGFGVWGLGFGFGVPPAPQRQTAEPEPHTPNPFSLISSLRQVPCLLWPLELLEITLKRDVLLKYVEVLLCH